jgi:hypothetical protein
MTVAHSTKTFEESKWESGRREEVAREIRSSTGAGVQQSLQLDLKGRESRFEFWPAGRRSWA